ncbi:MAG: hypothetical protein ABII22_04400 [Candidatus Micrarchaeota archaeon]
MAEEYSNEGWVSYKPGKAKPWEKIVIKEKELKTYFQKEQGIRILQFKTHGDVVWVKVNAKDVMKMVKFGWLRAQ